MNTELLAHELETLRNGFECLRLGYPSTEGDRQSTARALNNLARELELDTGSRVLCLSAASWQSRQTATSTGIGSLCARRTAGFRRTDMRRYHYNDRAYMRAHNEPMVTLRRPPAKFAKPHDDLTLMYLRQWWRKLSAEEKARQPALIADLVKPWYTRGMAWQAVTMRAHKVPGATTPYQKSPPATNAAMGQGAVQLARSKRKRKAKSNAPEPAHDAPEQPEVLVQEV